MSTYEPLPPLGEGLGPRFRPTVTTPMFWLLTLSATWVRDGWDRARPETQTVTLSGVVEIDHHEPLSRADVFQRLHNNELESLVPHGADLITSHVLFFDIRPCDLLRG